MVNVIVSVITPVLLIALIFLVYQNQKNRYSCTEDGCKITPFGKFSTLKSCTNNCNKNKSENSNTPLINNSKMNLQNDLTHTPSTHTPATHTPATHTPATHTPSSPKSSAVSNVNPETSKVNIPDKINKNNMNNLYINYNNVNNIQEQIKNKKQPNPYFATTKQSKSVITDYDTFPYPRYFRGKPESSLPIVAEREAGWRPRHDDAYKSKVDLELTPDCVMGSPSSNFLKLYKEEIYHCYDDNGNIIKDYTCNAGDNCYDNDPSQCTNVGGIVGAPKVGICTDSGALFNCPGGSANCFNDSTLYCPVQNIVQRSCPATSGQTFKCDANDQYCVNDSELYCPKN